jgi:hypothetical protein
MANTELTYVGLRVTEDCDAGRVCKARCFSQEAKLMKDPSLVTVMALLDALREANVQTINIMGGEPTTRNDLPQILEHAKAIGLQTVLSTNAIRLDGRRLDELEPYVDWLSLSLDADTREANDRHRGHGQWDGAMRVRDWFRKDQRQPHWKVNTQVHALNKCDIAGIPDVLGETDVWKLLQWTPRAEAAKVMGIYAVTAGEYADVIQAMRFRHPNQRIVERPYPEPDPDTAIVRPDGTLQINSGRFEYQVVGHLLKENSKDVFERAAVLYEQFPTVNRAEFNESYPVIERGNL